MTDIVVRLPACMMPDGADPCEAFTDLQTKLDVESAMVRFHQENERILKAENERLRAMLDALWIAFQDNDAFRRVYAELKGKP